jgi:hypothetical protein
MGAIPIKLVGIGRGVFLTTAAAMVTETVSDGRKCPRGRHRFDYVKGD